MLAPVRLGLHRLEHVSRAFVVEAGHDLDLVVLGQLGEHVGELLVVEGSRDLRPALGAEVADDLGEVGGLEVVVGLEQSLSALSTGLLVQPGHIADVDEHRLARASPRQPRHRLRRRRHAGGGLAHEHLDAHPVAALALLDGEIFDERVAEAGGDGIRGGDVHDALEQLGGHENLVRALFEAAHVDQAGGDDGPGVDRGDAGHRHEHPTPAGHLDDEPDHPGLGTVDREHHDDIAHPADLVTERVEDAQAGQSRHEHAGVRTHAAKAMVSVPLCAGARQRRRRRAAFWAAFCACLRSVSCC